MLVAQRVRVFIIIAFHNNLLLLLSVVGCECDSICDKVMTINFASKSDNGKAINLDFQNTISYNNRRLHFHGTN